MIWTSDDFDHLLSCLSTPHKRWGLDFGEAQTVKVDFLDDAEHRITLAKQFLLKAGDAYQLLSNEDNPIEWQQGKIEFAKDIVDSTACQIVETLTDIRLLETIVSAEYSLHELAWRDDEGKAVLKGRVYQINQSTHLVLQPIRGYNKSYDWALQLLNRAGYKAENRSVWQSLLEASDYQPSQLNQVKSPKLTSSQPARAAIFSMIVPMLKKARLNEEGIKTKTQDIEYLHEYRVSLRKSRSLVSLFKDIFPEQELSWFKKEMGELGRKTNLLRDLDVYMQEQQAYEALVPEPLRAGIPVMFADFAQQHKSAKTATKRWLASKQYQQKVTKLQTAFAAPDQLAATDSSKQDIYALVTDKLHKRYKKIAKLGSRITPATADEEVHELRIECKKFRYLMEFFAQLYTPSKIKILIKKLKKLQDTLGKFNDFSVQQESLSAYLKASKPTQAVTVSVGALLAVLAQKQLEQRQQVEAKFAEFADQQTAAMVAEFFPHPSRN